VKVFLAGAAGVVGLPLAALLRDFGHDVAGTTRSSAKAPLLHTLGVTPVVVDVFDVYALARAVETARPDLIIHQLSDLQSAPGTPGYPVAQEANRRLRIGGTRNLMQAAYQLRKRSAIWVSTRRSGYRNELLKSFEPFNPGWRGNSSASMAPTPANLVLRRAGSRAARRSSFCIAPAKVSRRIGSKLRRSTRPASCRYLQRK
jgi:nucleoside-diphosphate-sugar epimerase